MCLPSFIERTLVLIVHNRFSYVTNPPIYDRSPVAASEPCQVEMPSSPCLGSHSLPVLPLMNALLSSLRLNHPVQAGSLCGCDWSPHNWALIPMQAAHCVDTSCALPHLMATGLDCSGKGESFSGILKFLFNVSSYRIISLSFCFFLFIL